MVYTVSKYFNFKYFNNMHALCIGVETELCYSVNTGIWSTPLYMFFMQADFITDFAYHQCMLIL